jgi:acetoin:2,6-dichlorophenolindophenol oxidoreductase subunit beta
MVMSSRSIRYLQAVNEALHEAMGADDDVLILGEDIRGAMRGETRGLFERFGGDRVVDTPISEAGFTGMATGAALDGRRVVVEYQINSLPYLAFDQIYNGAQKLRYMMGGQGRIAVKYLVIASGAGNGVAGQHSDNNYPLLVHGGIKAILPSTPRDAKGLTLAAIFDDDPVALYFPAPLLGVKGDVPEGWYTVPLGVGEIKRSGRDVTVAATGWLVREALGVAEVLAKEGIDVEVYDPRSLLPFDRDTLAASVRKTGRLVIADDSNRTCGFAAEISAFAAQELYGALRAPVIRITRADVTVPYSPPLERHVLPNAERITAAVRSVAEFTPGHAGAGAVA